MKKSLIFFAMLLVACDPDDMFNINDTIPTDTVPQQPDPQPVSLVGTPSGDAFFTATAEYYDRKKREAQQQA